MKRRIFLLLLMFSLCVMPVRADTVRWVDFDVPYESLKYAMDRDIATFDQEKHLRWTEVLALAACRTGGKCDLDAVRKAAEDLSGDLFVVRGACESRVYGLYALIGIVIAGFSVVSNARFTQRGQPDAVDTGFGNMIQNGYCCV